jgi:nitric oxide reductase NorQ protein
MGRYLIKNMETVWQDGPVTQAVRQGAILYLDEISEAREDVIVALHALTDHRRELYLDRLNETLQAPKEFMCVASFNPGYQRGLKDLKPSTRQRFVTLALNYPHEDIESEIIHKITNLDKETSKKMASFAKKIRSQPQLSLKETVSTRLLVHTAKLIVSGLKHRQACEVGIAQVLTDDPKTFQALADMIAINF